MLLFFIPLAALAAAVLTLIPVRAGGPSRCKKRLALHAGVFLAAIIVTVAGAVCVNAQAPEDGAPAGQTQSEEAREPANNNSGMGYLAAALATGLSCLGAGIAIASTAPAAIGAFSEDPKAFGKALIFVVLGEGVALYGLLISILLINKL